MIVAIIGIVFTLAIAVGPVMSDVEIPNYEVVKSEGDIQIRKYAPMIIAEVQMSGKREDAIGDGFRLLADYIFGNNIANQDIAMTAPVQQQESTKIAMTAPVQQQSAGNYWQVSFVIPSEYTMDTLPKPVNERVVLKEIPAKTFAAITFSGTNSDENVKAHEKILLEYVEANDLSVISTPKYAFYNPPWTLPPMRRNEVMIEIQE
ncbi:SOUL family heme-binding protein [Cycloclasticus pugetii]|uniref:SOUL family heme-binding protein n=1 Tax=Cycloclasticus pugetii TaxID=34068 RepID=UPI003A9000E7